jgi:alpha(1,3/1,4) fucosyltransferase
MKLRVFFKDFWPGFKPEGSIFDYALRKSYNVEWAQTERAADLVLHSEYMSPLRRALLRTGTGVRRPRKAQLRILYSGEVRNIDIRRYDAVISTNILEVEKHFRLPQWVHYVRLWPGYVNRTGAVEAGFDPASLSSPVRTNPDRFACAVFSNPHYMRLIAIDKLAAFGEVDVFGRYSGRPVKDKMSTLMPYRFNLCFENAIMPGYVTEKVLHAKLAGCIPLWWGDPSYTVDFAHSSLINMYEYGLDFRRVFEEVDLEEIQRTPLAPRGLPGHADELAAFFRRIVG